MGFALPAGTLREIDTWIAEDGRGLSRPEALAVIIERGLRYRPLPFLGVAR
jgi:hypothetical protein